MSRVFCVYLQEHFLLFVFSHKIQPGRWGVFVVKGDGRACLHPLPAAGLDFSRVDDGKGLLHDGLMIHPDYIETLSAILFE